MTYTEYSFILAKLMIYTDNNQSNRDLAAIGEYNIPILISRSFTSPNNTKLRSIPFKLNKKPLYSGYFTKGNMQSAI